MERPRPATGLLFALDKSPRLFHEAAHHSQIGECAGDDTMSQCSKLSPKFKNLSRRIKLRRR